MCGNFCDLQFEKLRVSTDLLKLAIELMIVTFKWPSSAKNPPLRLRGNGAPSLSVTSQPSLIVDASDRYGMLVVLSPAR